MQESGSFLCVGDSGGMYMTSMKNSRDPMHPEEPRIAKTWSSKALWPQDEEGEEQNGLAITCAIKLRPPPGSLPDGKEGQWALNGDCKPTGSWEELARVNPSDILDQRGVDDARVNPSTAICWMFFQGRWRVL